MADMTGRTVDQLSAIAKDGIWALGDDGACVDADDAVDELAAHATQAEADRDRAREWVSRIWDNAEQDAWDEQHGPDSWAREMRKAKQAAEAEAARLRELTCCRHMLEEEVARLNRVADNLVIAADVEKERAARLREQLDAATQDRDSARMAAHNYLASFQAAEAEATRLREQRDAATEEREEWIARTAAASERWEAAEARYAQLEQALREVRFYKLDDVHGRYVSVSYEDRDKIRALAGPDTPADRKYQIALRHDDLGLDDVVVRHVEMFRMERMDNDFVWLACYLTDGQEIVFDLWREGKTVKYKARDPLPKVAYEKAPADSQPKDPQQFGPPRSFPRGGPDPDPDFAARLRQRRADSQPKDTA